MPAGDTVNAVDVLVRLLPIINTAAVVIGGFIAWHFKRIVGKLDEIEKTLLSQKEMLAVVATEMRLRADSQLEEKAARAADEKEHRADIQALNVRLARVEESAWAKQGRRSMNPEH